MLRQELAGQELWEPGGSGEWGRVQTTVGRGLPVTSHSSTTSSPSVTLTSSTASTLGDTETKINNKLLLFIQIINAPHSRTLDLPARNMTQTWRVCYLEGKLGLMVLILTYTIRYLLLFFYSFVLTSHHPYMSSSRNPPSQVFIVSLNLNWLFRLLNQVAPEVLWSQKFSKINLCWLKFHKSENPSHSRDVTFALT